MSDNASSREPFGTAVLRLCRIGTWFSPAADVLASTAIVQIAFGVDVLRAMLASVLIYGGGMVWNDIADRNVDRIQRPERPIPSGDLSLGFAVGLGLVLLVGGILISPCWKYHCLIATLVLIYDFISKKAPWIGALNMGVLRGLNLATGLALAGPMQTEYGPLLFFSEAHQAVLVAACCYGIYIVAVTIIGIFEDTPGVSSRAVTALQSAPPIVALAGIAVVQGGFWPAPAVAALPALWFLRRNARIQVWPQAKIRQSMMYLLLGTMLYTSLLALASDRPIEAAAIALAIPVARAIARRIALT